MALTNTEQGLIGSLVGLFAGGIGVFFGSRGKVLKSECALKHKGLDDLITAQFNEVRSDLKEIKAELRLVRNGQ